MAIRPLKPQSVARVEYDMEVEQALCSLLDCSNSDAQDIMQAQADIVDRYYGAGDTPVQCAAAVDRASHPADQGTQPAAETLQADIATPGAEFGTATTGNLLDFSLNLADCTVDIEPARISSPMELAGNSASDIRSLTFAGLGRAALLERCNTIDMAQFGILARRIVACFNACDGIDTNTLKGWGTGGVQNVVEQFKAQARDLGRANVNLTAALGEAHEQRDDHEHRANVNWLLFCQRGDAIAEKDAMLLRLQSELGRTDAELRGTESGALKLRAERDALQAALQRVVSSASPIGYHAEGGIGGSRAPVYHPAIEAARKLLTEQGL